MSKFSNIYDIDGNLIHKAGDGPFTIEDTEKLIDELTKKVEENPENEVYKVYLNNAHKWLAKLYNEMTPEQKLERINALANSLKEAQEDVNNIDKKALDEANKIMEEFKAQYEPKTQEDMLVERDAEPVEMEEIIE